MITAALIVLLGLSAALVIGGLLTTIQFLAHTPDRHQAPRIATGAEYRIDQLVHQAFGQMLDEARRHRQG